LPRTSCDSEAVARAVEALLLAEKQIRLLERVRPLRLSIELERLVSIWNEGREPVPQLCYAPVPDLSRLRRGLALLIERSSELGPYGPWFESRALEFALDAAMVEGVGTPAFGAIAMKRFPLPLAGEAVRVDSLVGEWASVEELDDTSRLYRSDDSFEPNSLYSIIQEKLREVGLTATIQLEKDLSSVAAVGDNTVSIRIGAQLSVRQSRRVAVHEVLAHLIPRKNAQLSSGLLKCGSAGSDADEEGRAILIEERSTFMDAVRKQELTFRHLACVWSRHGADFVQVIRGLRERGASVSNAVVIALRCFRGSARANCSNDIGLGGLGREIVYLPAYLRIKEAFAASPNLEYWFERGRTSLKYAQFLATRPL
jgi:hypothetical protein